jgi:hypothetical protein
MQCPCHAFSSTSCPALQNVSIFSHKRHDFRKKKLLSTKCVVRGSICLIEEKYFILGRNERNMTKNIRLSASKVPVISVAVS